MPGTHLIPGFFGKLPTSGDFVTRRLPPGFVRAWDRWCVRHIVPRLDRAWPACGLRFLHPGPVTGLLVPSADRAGRRFPLTLAAAAPLQAAAWYDALARLAARAAALAPDALETALVAHPAAGDSAAPVRLRLWSDGAPLEADPETPAAALDALLPERAEVG